MKINFDNKKNNQNQQFFLKINQEMDSTLPRENAKNSDLSMRSKIVSQTGGETLPPMSIELRVYTSLRFNPNIEIYQSIPRSIIIS